MTKWALSIISLILGILGFGLLWVKYLGLLLAIAAVVVSTIGIILCVVKNYKGLTMPIVGLILAVLAIGAITYTSEPFQKYATCENMQYLVGEPVPRTPLCTGTEIRFDTGCCTDENTNNICDLNEIVEEEPVKEELEEEITEEVVEEEPEEITEEEPTQEETELNEAIEHQTSLLDEKDMTYMDAAVSTNDLTISQGELGVVVVRIKNKYSNYDENFFQLRLSSTKISSWIKDPVSVAGNSVYYGPYEIVSGEYIDIPIIIGSKEIDDYGTNSEDKTYSITLNYLHAFGEGLHYDQYEDPVTMSISII